MAETDLDTIRASYVALNHGDVQAALDALHREAVWRESPELPGGDDFEGRAAIEEFLVGYLEQWDVFQQQVESTLSRGERVLVNIQMIAVGRESGAEVRREDQARRPRNLRRCERGAVGERVGGRRGLAGDLEIVDVDAIEANGRVGVQQEADPSVAGAAESPGQPQEVKVALDAAAQPLQGRRLSRGL